MLAVLLTGTKLDPHVEVGDIDAPVGSSDRLIVDVVAAGITWLEPTWITGWQNADGTPRSGPVVLGCDFAGRVRSLGESVSGFSIGQDVFGMTDAYHKGAMAQCVSVSVEEVLPMPKALTHDRAASLPLSGLTAWQALVRHGDVRNRQRVLIHGGAGAVGTFAIQIARWLGAYVVVTARGKDEELCKSLGADEVIDFETARFEDRGRDFDLVFDQIGGDVQERSWAVVKRGGKLVTIAGDGTEAPDQKRAHAIGISAQFFIVDRDRRDLERLTELVVAGTVRPVISQRLHFASVAEAFRDHSRRVAGKTFLICGDH